MKRLLVCLVLLAVSASAAVAQPFTRRSSQEKHDGLKKYYEKMGDEAPWKRD